MLQTSHEAVVSKQIKNQPCSLSLSLFSLSLSLLFFFLPLLFTLLECACLVVHSTMNWSTSFFSCVRGKAFVIVSAICLPVGMYCILNSPAFTFCLTKWIGTAKWRVRVERPSSFVATFIDGCESV